MFFPWFIFIWALPVFSDSEPLIYYNSTHFDSTTYPNITTNFGHANANSSNNFQYRGVALGGWLLLEPWITPLLFDDTIPSSGNVSAMAEDEYSFCKNLGPEEAFNRLQTHWDSFYKECDFEEMRRFGFNMVRIPIGYWAFDKLLGDPYIFGAQEYLDKAIEWAHNNDLKVWIDLHGAPGSQNGFDNSGQFLNNTPSWQKDDKNVKLTLLVLRQIYSKYGSKDFYEKYGDTILGIEVLNEPMGPKLDMGKLEDFYRSTYTDARVFLDTNLTVVFHDAFQPLSYWNSFLNTTGDAEGRLKNYNILIDHHHYEVFSVQELNLSITQHLNSIRNYADGILKERNSHPAVLGEWSAALTDCTPYLNSVHFGTRWEGTYPYTNEPVSNQFLGSCENINQWKKWSKEHKRFTRKYIEMQLDHYELQMNGWIFWTYKTEEAIEWDFKRLAKYGLFPQPFSLRRYIKNGVDLKPELGASLPAKLNVMLGLAAIVVLLTFC